jgi:hypothetical protein
LETHIKELGIVEFLANFVKCFYQLWSYMSMKNSTKAARESIIILGPTPHGI